MPTSIYLLGFVTLLAGSIVSGFLYFRKGKTYSKPVFYTLFVLRALAFALLFFVLIAPFIPIKSKEIIRPIVAVLVDNSSSMVLGKDSAEIKSSLFATLNQELSALENAETVFFSYDDLLRKEEPDFTGSATDMANALNQVYNEVGQERIAAVVLVSDGIVNLGSNPLYSIENAFVPVFTLAVGDSTRQKDISIVEVRAPEYVFRGDEIVIDVTVSAENISNHLGEIELRSKSGKIASKTIKVQSDAFAKVYSFSLKAGASGLYSYSLNIKPVDGERNTTNNERQFFIEVIENRKKIAVLANAPGPDVQAVREALKKVEAYNVYFANASKGEELNAETELAIVFCQAFANADLLSKALNNYDGALWLIIDPIADAQLFKDKLAFVSKVGRPQSIPVKAKFNSNFGLFKLSEEAERALAQFPSVNIFTGTTRVNGTFENLLMDPQGKPIASYGSVENKKLVLFNLSGLWGWRVADFKQNKTHKHFDELLQVTTQYLTANDNSNRLKLRYEKRIPSANSLKITATVYDATFTESTSASVKLALKNEADEVLNFDFTQNADDYELLLPTLKAGKYTFNAIAKLGEEELRSSGAFFVESQSLEQMNTRANYPLLAQLATASGGAFYTLNNASALRGDINNNAAIKPIEKIRTESIALVDLMWMFYLILVLFAAEWATRRYFGKI